MKQIVLRTIDIAWRVLVVACGYTLTLILAGVVLGMVGLLEANTNQGVDVISTFLWMFAGGLIMGLMLGLVARRLYASAVSHLLIWSVLIFANIGSVIIEGYYFAPELVSNVWITVIQQLPPCLVTAGLVYWLFAPRAAEVPTAAVYRAWYEWLWRYGLSALTYLATYWVFGGLNFALVTRPYYEAQGTPLVVPEPQTILQAESIRAVLIVLSLLPFLQTAEMPLRRLAVWSGLLLFVIGGIVPLTWQAGTLALPLLLASGVEIFFQNFTTGVVTALLLAWPTAVPVIPRAPRRIKMEEM